MPVMTDVGVSRLAAKQNYPGLHECGQLRLDNLLFFVLTSRKKSGGLQQSFYNGHYHVGRERGTYIRLDSTNRQADHDTILALQMLAKNISFDELPRKDASLIDLDEQLIKTQLASQFSKMTQQHYTSLGITVKQGKLFIPTNGGLLLFAKNRF